MSYEEKDQIVNDEIKRLITVIDSFLKEPDKITESLDKQEISFNQDVFKHIKNMCLRGLISAYNQLIKSNHFCKSSEEDKIDCLQYYRNFIGSLIKNDQSF